MLVVLLATVAAVAAKLVEPSAFGMKDEGDAGTLPATSFVEKKTGQETGKKEASASEAMMLSFVSKEDATAAHDALLTHRAKRLDEWESSRVTQALVAATSEAYVPRGAYPG